MDRKLVLESTKANKRHRAERGGPLFIGIGLIFLLMGTEPMGAYGSDDIIGLLWAFCLIGIVFAVYGFSRIRANRKNGESYLNVYEDGVQGKNCLSDKELTVIGLLGIGAMEQREFELSYSEIKNVELGEDRILLHTDHGDYLCRVGNGSALRQAIRERIKS